MDPGTRIRHAPTGGHRLLHPLDEPMRHSHREAHGVLASEGEMRRGFYMVVQKGFEHPRLPTADFTLRNQVNRTL